MKTLLILALSLTTAPAFAGTLSCKARSLAYSYNATDGGAYRGSVIDLVLEGRTLIHVEPFGGNELRLASFELGAKRTVLKVERTPDYVTTTFRSPARVLATGDARPLFAGMVLCRESRYVGPPRP